MGTPGNQRRNTAVVHAGFDGRLQSDSLQGFTATDRRAAGKTARRKDEKPQDQHTDKRVR
jgi:hypothetical protein